MSHSTREALRHVLLIGYDDLRARLARRFGSVELASDALHETWLRLENATPAATVLSPKHYVLQMAANAALKSLNAQNRFVALSDAKLAIGLADDAPDQERNSIARSDLDAFARALSELTPRRREILLLSRLKGIPLWAIAERLGVSQRFVEMELKHALAFCALRLDRTVIKRFGPKPRKGSKSEGEGG
jgi:RNA polymerase sigma-70 factor (ECF subfamily)